MTTFRDMIVLNEKDIKFNIKNVLKRLKNVRPSTLDRIENRVGKTDQEVLSNWRKRYIQGKEPSFTKPSYRIKNAIDTKVKPNNFTKSIDAWDKTYKKTPLKKTILKKDFWDKKMPHSDGSIIGDLFNKKSAKYYDKQFPKAFGKDKHLVKDYVKPSEYLDHRQRVSKSLKVSNRKRNISRTYYSSKDLQISKGKTNKSFISSINWNYVAVGAVAAMLVGGAAWYYYKKVYKKKNGKELSKTKEKEIKLQSKNLNKAPIKIRKKVIEKKNFIKRKSSSKINEEKLFEQLVLIDELTKYNKVIEE